jgi:hypothetical protein
MAGNVVNYFKQDLFPILGWLATFCIKLTVFTAIGRKITIKNCKSGSVAELTNASVVHP